MLYKEKFVISLSTLSHLHPSFAYGGQSLLPHLGHRERSNTFQPEALVQHISTTAQRERYAPKYFIIGVKSYMLCGKTCHR